MGKDNEDVFAGLLPRNGVHKGLVDVGVIHIEISTEDAPENTFECRHTGTLDGARNESWHNHLS